MQKWMLVVVVAGLAGCKKNVETEVVAGAESGPADMLRVKVEAGTSWTAIKATCSGGSFTQIFTLEGGVATATGLPGTDCLVELMPGSAQVAKDVGAGHSYKCAVATGGGADCANAYEDALLVEVQGGDFKSVHVECPASGYDKNEVLRNGSALLHGLAKDCLVSLNPGEVPAKVTVYRGQRLVCHADRSDISECSVQ